MKKRMRRLVAMLLAAAVVVQQGSTSGVLAVETESMSESFAEAMAISQEPETKAEETKAPETQAPETKVEETKAPETQTPETKVEETKAPETQTPETKVEETKAPETLASETKVEEMKASEALTSETKAEETEQPPQNTLTEETVGETSTESEQVTEPAAEPETELASEVQSEPITEAAAEEVTEAASETVAEAESEKESETEETVALEASIMQEVFQKTVEDAAVPMVKYTVKLANKAEKTAAEGISLKVLLADELSYKKEDGETPELVSFETLGKAIEAAVFENELTEADKTAYANGGVVLWKDQTIAAGEEKTFVFYAEVKDGQTDVNALKNLWFVDGEAVAAEKIQWANTELLEVKPAIAEPQTYKYVDDKVVIKVTVPEGVELPYGAELKADPVPENSKEYADAVKAVEAANPDVVFNEHIFYDVYFAYEGEEVEPVGGDVSVQMKFKDTIKTDVKDVEGETTVVASHIKDNGALEDVTDEVKLNKKDEVSSVRFSTDSFSIMGISGGEEVSHMTDDKLDDYTLEFLLRNFNIVSFGNVTLDTHCMGGVLIKGDLSGTASGFADSANVTEESYIGGYVSFNGRCNDRNNSHPENWAVYVGSGNAESENEITSSDKGPNTVLNNKEAFNGRPNDGAGPVLMTDDYVNWTTLSAAATNTMNSLVARSAETFSASYDWVEITVQAGSNVSLQTNGHKVKIKLEGDATATTIINVLDSDSVNMPQVTGLTSEEDGTSMPIAFTFPNATTVNIVSELSPSFGHVIAPGATIDVNNCNYNGCLVGGNMSIKGEGHMWPYTGGSLIPTSGGFSASKTVDGTVPKAGQTFKFKLDELKDGVWTNVQTKSNNGSKVEFDKITYADKAEHWYIIYEDPDQEVTGYTLSDVLYLVKVIIEENTDSEGNTVYSVKTTKYFEPKDGVSKDNLLKDGSMDESLLAPLTSEAQFIFDNKELTSKEVQKVWVDENDKDNLRPEKIEVQLLADGKAYGDLVELNEDNGWSHTWENLPKKANGMDIAYTVEEIGEVTGYTTAYATDETTGKTTITNTHAPGTVEKTVTKKWADNDDQDGLRPEKIDVQLFTNGKAYGDPVELNAENDWTYTWKNLPEKEDGTAVSYTVEELGEISGYTTAYDQAALTITNTHTAETTSKEVEKVWADGNDKDGLRPEKIEVQLLADDVAYGVPVELNAGNKWSYKWEDLPKKAAGKDIDYTVKEIGEVSGYTTAYATDETTGKTTITNTHVVYTDIVLGATKVFDKTLTGDDFTFKLEELNADGTVKTGGVSLSAKNKADGTIPFASIPYTEEGTYYYQISEVIPTGVEKDASVLYDATVKKVTVTVEVKDGRLTATADVAAKDVVFTNRLTSVKVSKVDVTTGAELEGAHIQILDKDGNVVEEWDSTKEAHEVKGLKTGETYTLKETVAPDGYTVTAETTFTLNEDGTVDSGKTTTKSKDGVLLVEDSMNRIRILKVDESGKALKGAKLVIKDAEGAIVGEPWKSGSKAHDITGLAKGEYTLSEIEAPESYQVSADVPFEITGEETADQIIEVKMTDKKIPKSDTYSAEVTKHLRLDGITSDIGVKNAVYYVALFSDEARTRRVSDVKQIRFENQISSTVTFENLAKGTTYYVGETDANGTRIDSVKVNDRLLYYPEYGENAHFEIEGGADTVVADFTNVYVELTDDFYLSGQITVTKKILINGEEGTSDATYYAGVFNSADMSEPLEIIPLVLGGGSSTSYTVTNLPIGSTIDSTMTYYVTETDENGVPLDPEAVKEFEVSVDKSEIVLSANDSRQEVVITNSFTEEETETETDTEVPKKEAPKTGDDTDFMRYLLMMVLSVGVCAAVFEEKRRKAGRVRK